MITIRGYLKMDIREIKEVQELLEVLQEVSIKVQQFGKLLVNYLYIGISGTRGSLPINIYNTLNEKILEMEQAGVKPILILGDDTDGYLSCYLFNMLRTYDGLDPITLGGCLVYKGKEKGIYLDTTRYRGGVGLVFLDTDIVFPSNSVSLTNHINLMSDSRILNVNNYLGRNSLKEYTNKYPLGTTHIFLSVCKTRGIEIPQELFNYFIRCDMSKLPKNIFMSNILYHLKVLDLDKEFKSHMKDVRERKIKSSYKLFDSITVEEGSIKIAGNRYPVIKKLKEFNSPHKDVRLANLTKVYDLETLTMNVDDDGALVGNVEDGTFTVYKRKKEYYYTRVIPVYGE